MQKPKTQRRTPAAETEGGAGDRGAMHIWKEATICCLKWSSWDWRKFWRDAASIDEMPVEDAESPSPSKGAEDTTTDVAVEVVGAAETPDPEATEADEDLTRGIIPG